MLPTPYQEFIHQSRYARWLEDEKRRETWNETVTRYIDFLVYKTEGKLSVKTATELGNAIHNLEVMPSMRALMTAGPALDRCNVAGYNCSYLPVDHPRAFDETLYILMCGTGVGFSVERKYVEQLPIINEHFEESDTTIIVADTKQGWAKGLKELIAMLYSGQIPKWDLSRLRPEGAPLKTFGGRSSGPAPLDSLFKFCVEIFKNAAGRRLTGLECHDIMCRVGECVVVGGVRRSALISLSDIDDLQMRSAKFGQWYTNNLQRRIANNSVAYNNKPSIGEFMQEWLYLYNSKSGERGIFNRQACALVMPERRNPDYEWGTNPCSEIILRPYQFCNLTEVVVRYSDTVDDLKRKIRVATILGTLQATLTNFKYLRKIWTTNTEEERLLGVSLTGIMEHPILNNYNNDNLAPLLRELRNVVVETNRVWAKKLGIPHSAATTCVKPSGTVSQLVNSPSGIHAAHSSYYIRRVRCDKKDPITKFMSDHGFPMEDDTTSPKELAIFSFPIKTAPKTLTRNDITPIEHLNLWLAYQDNWCEHKPSITVNVRESEWMEVGAWVWEHFNKMSGVSFLPHSEHIYTQAPYEEITKKEYLELLKKMPISIPWEKLAEYEDRDNTLGSQELACTGNACEIADVL